MQNFAKWLTRGCEFIAAMILAAIFIIFLLQICARYTSKIAWLIPIEQLSNWMLTVEPIGYFTSTSSHGCGVNCFKPRETRFLSGSY